jgi:O-antigen/teichoic acid export membrane protein
LLQAGASRAQVQVLDRVVPATNGVADVERDPEVEAGLIEQRSLDAHQALGPRTADASAAPGRAWEPTSGSAAALASSGHFIRSVFRLGLSQLASWIGAAVLAIMLPIYLGAGNLGKFSFAYALATLVGLFATFGSTTFISKRVAQDPAVTPVLASAALAVRLPLGIAVALSTALIFSVIEHDDMTRRLIYIFSFGIVLSALDVATACLQGLQRMGTLAISQAASKLIWAGLTALLLLHRGGAVEVAAAWAISVVASLAITYVVLLRNVRLSYRPPWSICRQVLAGGLPFFVWSAALVVYGQIDTIMLSFLSGDRVVGWYAASYRVVSLPGFVPVIAVTIILPALAAAAGIPDLFNRIARRSLQLVTISGLPMALGIMLLPDKVIHLLHYPADFSNSLIPIVLMAPHVPLVGIDMVIGTVLIVSERQRAWAITAVAAAILNPAVNLLAIPLTQRAFGNGAIGAAAVTTLTEVFMMVVGLRLLPRGVFDRTDLDRVARIVLAGLMMAGAVWVARDLPIVVTVIVGAVSYFTTAAALGQLTRSDATELIRYVARRGGAR